MEKPNFKKVTFLCMQQLTNFPYIEEDFDALTNYELLSKVVEYLNKVIANLNEQNESIIELYNSFNSLKNYVDNYFENLDVQDEINNKLDEMAEAGTLQEIIANYLNSKALFGFDTVADMKAATNLINGSYARTLGYHTKNDGGKALYKIRTITNDDVVDNMFIVEMSDNTLIAELIINDSINVKQIGAYGDGEHDDTNSFDAALSYNNIFIPEGTYLIDFKNINLTNKTITGAGKDKSIIKQNNINNIFGLIGNSTIIRDLKFIANNNTSATALFNFGVYNGTNIPFVDHEITNLDIDGNDYLIPFNFYTNIRGCTGGNISHININKCLKGVYFYTADRGWITHHYMNNIFVIDPVESGFEQNTSSQFSHNTFIDFSVEIFKPNAIGFKFTRTSDLECLFINPSVFNDNNTGTSYSLDIDNIGCRNKTVFIGGLLEGDIKNKKLVPTISFNNTNFIVRENSTVTNPTSFVIRDNQEFEKTCLFNYNNEKVENILTGIPLSQYNTNKLYGTNINMELGTDINGDFVKLTPAALTASMAFYYLWETMPSDVNYAICEIEYESDIDVVNTAVSYVNVYSTNNATNTIIEANNRIYKRKKMYFNIDDIRADNVTGVQLKLTYPSANITQNSYLKVYSIRVYTNKLSYVK